MVSGIQQRRKPPSSDTFLGPGRRRAVSIAVLAEQGEQNENVFVRLRYAPLHSCWVPMPPGPTLVRTRAVGVNGGGAMAGRAMPIRRVDTVRLGESPAGQLPPPGERRVWRPGVPSPFRC